MECAPISNRAARTKLKLPSQRLDAEWSIAARVASVATAHQQRRGAKRLLGRRWPECGTAAMLAVATFKLARTGAGSCNPGWSRPARVRICTLIAFSWDDSSWSNGASDSTTLSSPKLDAAHGKKAATSITEECKNTRAQHARRGKVRFAGREVDWFLLMGSWCPLGKADLDPPSRIRRTGGLVNI